MLSYFYYINPKFVLIDEHNQISYKIKFFIAFYNYSNVNYSIIKITCSDLQIIDTLILTQTQKIKNFLINYSNQYFYALISDYSYVGTCYHLDKIDLSNFIDIGFSNLTYFYVKTIINLTNLEIINDYLEVLVFLSFLSLIIESINTWGYFFTNFQNSQTRNYEIKLFKI
ncbi:hypothetical protein M0811_11574 [Anaeramoeba ignava]|uniref:Uncharacterized protein n=1 Tax=Anaeramoeba ignava TaxID=1746090 RepID=A0A9Q0R6T1_ANAIG|nr:hypothetical protein M0811_11574 [Anaeramoeba ignava]